MLEPLFYLIVFLLPIYLVRFSLFGAPTNILEILIIILAFIWVVKEKDKKIIPDKKYLLTLALLGLGLVSSLLTHENFWRGLGIVKGWFILPFILGIIYYDLAQKGKANRVFSVYYLSAFFMSVLAIIFLFLGKTTYDFRLQAMFNSPNYLAMYLSPAVLIVLGKIQSEKNRRIKFRIFSLATIVIALYFTFSYASWLAVATSIAIMFFAKGKVTKKFFILALLIIMLALFLQKDSIKLDIFNARSSFSSRIMIWKAAGDILRDNWFLGIGPGNFQDTYLEYQKYFPPYLEWAVPHSHNLFLTFWLYTGLLGLLGFLSLLAFWFRDFFKKQKSDIGIIALGIMVYILVCGIFDTTYFKNDLAVIFWLTFFVGLL